MIDLHCHILPGIDDGPKTLQEALQMAEYAVDQGIKHSILTPHIQPGCYDNDIASIQTAYQTFQAALDHHDIPLKISMAAEVRVCAELPQMISQNKIPFIGVWENKKVLLLEFPHDHIPVGADKLVAWLIARDIIPLIAHPERNQAILRQPDKLMPFIHIGCLLQVTASSVTGLFGSESQQCALRLIQQNLVTVLASDAHNLHKRQPTLRPALEYLEPIIGEQLANALVTHHPSRMVSA
ncbi:MAG: capsular biosynthesis protein [Methylococcales bacterium]|nr:capsular biosynthesis protein [Methylococcales bacterium]